VALLQLLLVLLTDEIVEQLIRLASVPLQLRFSMTIGMSPAPNLDPLMA